jgi:peptide/nickel transport system substrate-binding protein
LTFLEEALIVKKIILGVFILLILSTLVVSGCSSTTSPASSSTSSSPSTPPSVSATSTQTIVSPSSSEPSPKSSKYGGTLIVISPTVPSTIGWPAQQPIGGVTTVTQVCLETLLRQDNKGNIVPWLAESYKVADDLKSITFVLRKGIRFHDGSDFNAEVAAWNLDQMIKGKREANWASVDIIGDNTIRVNFTEWNNTLPSSFGDTSVEAFMVSKAAYDKNGVSWMRSNPVGTGPFKFVSFQQDTLLKYVRNTDYWKKDADGNQLPYLDGIEYQITADPSTRETILKSGAGDMTTTEAGKSAANQAQMGLTIKLNIELTELLMGDTANPDSPWANQKVREAAEYAIDREAISKALGFGFTEAPYQIPPRSTTAWDPDFAYTRKYDVEKAKQLLKEAGYPQGFKTTLIACPMGVNKDVCMAIQAYLAEAGIISELKYPEVGLWMTYQYPGKFPDNALVYQGLPMVDLSYAGGLQFMFGVVSTNWARTPEITEALHTALTSPAPDPNLVRVVTNLMSKEVLAIPVREGGAGTAYRPYLKDSGVMERGTSINWNSEQAWLDK